MTQLTQYKLVLALFFLVTFFNLSAQEIHFSQYRKMDNQLNPALTGFIPMEDNARIAMIYRDQWTALLGTASYKTMGFSVDFRNCLGAENNKIFNKIKHKFEGPSWGLGLSIVHDESGVQSVNNITDQSFPLNRDYINLSSSIILPLNDNLFFNTGFRFGTIFHRLKTQHLRYDEQFDGVAGFDLNRAGEFDNTSELNTHTLNLAGGVSLSYFRRDVGWSVGGAVDNIFVQGKYKWIAQGAEVERKRKYTVHGKLSFKVLHKKKFDFGLGPNFLFMQQQPYQTWVLGGDFFLHHTDGMSLTLGSGLRLSRNVEKGFLSDAIIANCSLYYNNLAFGFSYDLNSSKLNLASNGFGAVEFSVVYHFKRRNSKCVPAQVGCRDENTVHHIFY